MKTENWQTENPISGLLLTGCIFLANIDVAGLLDYSFKAITGGAIWLGYRFIADYLERKRRKQQ